MEIEGESIPATFSPLIVRDEPEPIGLSFDEFLRLEEVATVKHDFVRGFRFAMSGALEAHNVITMNCSVELAKALRGTDCRVFGSDMLVRIDEANAAYYPDVHVQCGEEPDPRSRFHKRPVAIVEILSRSTMRFDRGAKFEDYRQLASLKLYLLIDSERHHIEVRRRLDADDFESTSYTVGAIALEDLGITLAIHELYSGSGIP